MTSCASEKILLGCVADNNNKYLSQALRLVRSVRWFGGALKDVDIIVCVIDGVESSYSRMIESLGAAVRIVSRFDPANPLFNKIQFFRLPDVERYDTLFYLDCDTVVVQDPSPFLDGSSLQAKTADLTTVTTEALERLCRHFGLKPPERHYRTTVDRAPTVWYCNAGVVVCPVRFIPRLIPAWCEYELEFSAHPELLEPYQKNRSQAALALAFIRDPVPFKEFPVSMNFPLHLTDMETPLEMSEADPVILHYHDRVDDAGYLLHSPYPLAQKRIEAFNNRLAALEPPDCTIVELWHSYNRRRMSVIPVQDRAIDPYSVHSEAAADNGSGDLMHQSRELRAKEAEVDSLKAVLEIRDRDLEWLKTELKVREAEAARPRAGWPWCWLRGRPLLKRQ